MVLNQITETHRVADLAKIVSEITGAEIANLPNPRREADENDLVVLNEQFLALDLDGLTGIFAEQYAVANLDIHGNQLAAVVPLAGADGEDFTLIRLFCGGIGNHNAGRGLAFFFHAPDNYAIMQRTNFHSWFS